LFYALNDDKHLRQIQLITKGEKRSKIFFLICSYRDKNKPELLKTSINWVNNQDVLPCEDYNKVKSKAKIADSNGKKKYNKSQKRSTSYSEESCYSLGYKYGRCGQLALMGRYCPPADDIVIPERCRGLDSTHQGIRAGVASLR
jgi:hypothetical protein